MKAETKRLLIIALAAIAITLQIYGLLPNTPHYLCLTLSIQLVTITILIAFFVPKK